MTTIVIINESHSLFPQQEEILGDYERYNLPDSGANLGQVKSEIAPFLRQEYVGYSEEWEETEEGATLAQHEQGGKSIIFATPFAALMVELQNSGVKFGCLHNDKRSAKEVPDGKGGVRVVHSVSPDGWVIVW
jgi:hypothetical protein